jgi:nucleotidyltransferase/DNA polymerase involved in DNA repair
MVKPPKSMQPEGVNLEKAGRAAGKAFEDDSFRNYMARKIDMQRKQFGLLVPPDPREQEDIKEPTKARPEVHFAPDVVIQDTERPKKRKRKKKLGMDSVLRRLKRRHGRTGRSKSTETVKEDGGEGSHEAEPPAHAALHSESHPHCDVLQLDSETVKEDAGEDSHDTDPPNHAALYLDSRSVGATHCDVLQLDSETVKDDAGEGSHEADPPAHAALHSESWSVGATYCDALQMDSGSTFEKDDDSRRKSSIMAAQSVETPKKGDIVEHVSTPESKPTPPTKRVPVRPDLFFTGVVILVNGYTNPDTESLQRLMHKHGGDLEKYETSRLTHIIAEHLSTAKANIYKRQRRPTPVCSPSWVVDCVKSKRLLPHAPYLIKEVRDGDVGMKSVVSYFQGAPAEKKAQQQHPQDSDRERDRKKAAGYSLQSREATSVDVSEKPGSSVDVDFARQTSSKIAAVSLPESNHLATLAAQGQSSDAHTKPIANNCVDTVPDTKKPSNSSTKSDDKYINGRVRTTGTDPHFLESFFNQSRLSFIGSYKQRARQTLQKKAARRNGERRFVFHVDMDCFFASVVLRSFPEYQDKPVAISHHGKKRSSDGNAMESPVSKKSTSECATCNYRAREFGGKCISVYRLESDGFPLFCSNPKSFSLHVTVKKGMYLGHARELCPDLVVLQYDFEGYEEVSEQVTDILYQHAEELNGIVEQVSCDEAYMEIYVMSDGNKTPESIVGELAETIRKEVFDATQCTATVGVATNRMLAKLAGDRVKPNKTFVVEDCRELVRCLNLRDLHGVGYRSEQKLQEEALFTVQDVWDLGSQAEGELCRILGPGLGKKIFDSCNGRDDRPVEPAERKTIGAEVSFFHFCCMIKADTDTIRCFSLMAIYHSVTMVFVSMGHTA